MTVCSNFVLAFFLLKNVPLIIKNAWRGDEEEGKEDEENGSFMKLITYCIKLIKMIMSFFEEVEMLYYVAYGVLAILGVLIHPFFYTFHLTEIMMRYPSLKNILMSVYEPRK